MKYESDKITEEDYFLILRGLWSLINENRKQNISDFDEPSATYWKLKTKIERICRKECP